MQPSPYWQTNKLFLFKKATPQDLTFRRFFRIRKIYLFSEACLHLGEWRAIPNLKFPDELYWIERKLAYPAKSKLADPKALRHGESGTSRPGDDENRPGTSERRTSGARPHVFRVKSEPRVPGPPRSPPPVIPPVPVSPQGAVIGRPQALQVPADPGRGQETGSPAK